MFPDHGRSAAELIQHADTAMYGAKRQGPRWLRVLRARGGEAIYADLVLEERALHWPDAGEFELFLSAPDGRQNRQLAGAEALLRWRHPTRGLLSPDAFIFVAEQHRLMLPWANGVLREAASPNGVALAAGLTLARVPIAVNLARMQFNLEGFATLPCEGAGRHRRRAASGWSWS